MRSTTVRHRLGRALWGNGFLAHGRFAHHAPLSLTHPNTRYLTSTPAARLRPLTWLGRPARPAARLRPSPAPSDHATTRAEAARTPPDRRHRTGLHHAASRFKSRNPVAKQASVRRRLHHQSLRTLPHVQTKQSRVCSVQNHHAINRQPQQAKHSSTHQS